MKKKTGEDIVAEFVRHWGRQGKFDWEGQEIVIFPAIVTYFAKEQPKTIKTVVQIYFDGGRIEIIPKGWLDTDQYYTGLDPKYQTFSLNDEYALHIVGTGPKSGAYWVSLFPE